MRQSRHPEIMKECDGRYAEVSPSYEGGEKEGVGNLYNPHLSSPLIRGRNSVSRTFFSKGAKTQSE
jgi:hypothetical protein